MWRRKILQTKREEVKKILEEKLFYIDGDFGPILRKHRQNCKDMEKLRVIDMKQNGIDIAQLDTFLVK